MTWPRHAIQKNLTDSENICVGTYKKGPLVIRLDLESNTNILDDYFAGEGRVKKVQKTILY